MNTLRFRFLLLLDACLASHKARWAHGARATLVRNALRKLRLMASPFLFFVLPVLTSLLAPEAPAAVLWSVAALAYLSWGGLAHTCATEQTFVPVKPHHVRTATVGFALLGLAVFATVAHQSTALETVESADIAAVYALKALFLLAIAATLLLVLALLLDAAWTACEKASHASQKRWDAMSAHERMAFAKRHNVAPPQPPNRT